MTCHMPNPSHWNCPQCTLQNNQADQKCRVCETPSPSPVLEPIDDLIHCPQCSFRNSVDSHECGMCGYQILDEWSCPVCTLNNGPEDDRCHACTAPKPPAHLEEEIDALAGAAAPTTSAPALHPPCMWSCHRCTFDNGPEDDRCQMCQEPKPEDSYPVAEPCDALAGHTARDAPTPEEDLYQVVEFPEHLEEENELTACRHQLDEKVEELGELERELGGIRIRASLGVPTAALSPEQAQARRELKRAEMLHQYLQRDVLYLQTECTRLRIQQLEMA